MSPVNGWRDGKDPIQRWLRIVTVLVCLGVFAYLAVDPDAGVDALPVIAIAIGCVLVLLGYEGVVRIPGLSRDEQRISDDYERQRQKDDDDPPV